MEHFRNAGFKLGLRGTVRMETPVLYFYPARDMNVSVHVAFSKGLITEWYPHASLVGPAEGVSDAALYQPRVDGSIAWDSVALERGRAADLPREAPAIDNAYYAARETSAASVRVNSPGGDQHEKFLFYRGVSIFPVPISAKCLPDGSVLVSNPGQSEIPDLILFERRGDRVGYRSAADWASKRVLNLCDSPRPSMPFPSILKKFL